MREADLLPDWFVGGAGKRRLLAALLLEDPTRPPWNESPPWSKAQLAEAAGLHEKHSVWRHVAVLVEARLLLEDDGLYRLNRRSPLREPLRNLIEVLDRVPARQLPRSRGG
jgi:hypothetical protein